MGCCMSTLVFLVATLVSTPQAIDFDALDWEPLNSKEGIDVSRSAIPNMDILGVRGVGTVDLHIAKLWAVFSDVSKQPEWIDRLKETRLVSKPEEASVRYYSQYYSPWPISNRDFLFQRVINIDEENKIITVMVHSVEDEREPEADCCVRGWLSRAYWRFSAQESGKTKVEVEVVTDPKGLIPTWIINLVQRSWPVKSISNLVKRATQADVERTPELAAW